MTHSPSVNSSHAKTVMRRWGYLDDAQSVDCDCGEPQTMAHFLSCRLLDEACTADDLATVTERAKACARKWEKIVWRTRKKNSTGRNVLNYWSVCWSETELRNTHKAIIDSIRRTAQLVSSPASFSICPSYLFRNHILFTLLKLMTFRPTKNTLFLSNMFTDV